MIKSRLARTSKHPAPMRLHLENLATTQLQAKPPNAPMHDHVRHVVGLSKHPQISRAQPPVIVDTEKRTRKFSKKIWTRF